ncbi:hypothetical protein GYMLUDRAFT_247197 [Collybiopsis luxurians FD-317 M1]|uniref:Unplaced genomic scaffold GYMLUscaffold_44, whole genome shotgun sequence n=1 Tax=Collybiopsis luxurians FD-317 M1 TaxID=944289 RepID=A0A0D0CGD3_9AGAR|nr:hypothetical protein GYMLUDRAFT_247197 [Collybiopsis luxurians FD-317 M1]
MFCTRNISQDLSHLVVILPSSPLPTPPDTPHSASSSSTSSTPTFRHSHSLPPLVGDTKMFDAVADIDLSLFGSAAGEHGFTRPGSATSGSPFSFGSAASHSPITATVAAPIAVSSPRASLTPTDIDAPNGSDVVSGVRVNSFSTRTRTTSDPHKVKSIESADRSSPAAIAYLDSDRAIDTVNDLSLDLDSDSQHIGMEGTIRPSRRVSSGYGYGFPASPKPGMSDASHGDVHGDAAGLSAVIRARAHRAPQYDQSTVRGGSALSRAMAQPESGRQAQRIPQSQLSSGGSGRVRSTTAIPVSINGAPDEGDIIVSARWDHGVDGRRLLFLSYYPAGLQIWDCTDLDSISEVLNLPAESVRQLIADDESVPAVATITPGESVSDMVIEYAGIISPGRPELNEDARGPLVGMLVTPTEEKRDPVDEASDSVLLTAEDEEVPRDPATDNHCFLLIYSLSEHGVIKRIRLPGLSIGGGRFEVGTGFVAVGTTVPPSLHVLSLASFDLLHHIPSSDLLPFCHKLHTSSFSYGPQLYSRPHSFLETTSNLVNGIYNEHFNDNYHSNNNNRISERNHVLLPTLDHFASNSSSYPSSTSSDATRGHPGGPSLDYTRQRRASMQGHTSPAAETPSMAIPETTPLPAPIFAVSGHLLAYASLPEGHVVPTSSGMQLRTSSTLSSAAVSTASAFGSTLSAQLANLGGSGNASGALGALGGISQADVSNAALKVGGSVLSGMKTLGGLAYKSAVAAATDSGSNLHRRVSGGRPAGGGRVGGLANRFFSKSAPAATSSVEDRNRRYSTSSIGSTGIEGYEAGKTVGIGQETAESSRRPSVPPRTIPATESGYHVTVLDVSSVVTDTALTRAENLHHTSPAVVMQFIASKSQPVSSIWFSASGTSLLIAPRDGRAVQVYEIRSDPLARMTELDSKRGSDGKAKGSRSSPSPSSKVSGISPLHVYNLRRGQTSAVIESASWASDGRWLALGTRRRTIHVFAVNPYGGPADVQSHLDGRVRNISELPVMPSEQSPLVRLRASKHPGPEQPKVPLAFTFLETSVEAEHRLPLNLLPPITSPHLLPTNQHSYGSVNSNQTIMSSSPSTRSEPLSLSPRQQLSPNGRPRNYQDVLVFDPTDGILSLRRITCEAKPKHKDGPPLLGASFAPVNASRSLPGTGASGRLNASSSPTTSTMQRTAAGNPQASDGLGEMNGRDTTVASWNLRRGKDWSEKKGVLEGIPVRDDPASGQTNWLAQAELSTYSKSTRVLPRSIYLSHQFSFRALGEDYHALIRRFQLDVSGTKIDVRKGVEVSAYPTAHSESFVEGGGFAGSHRDRRRLSSSFDEPLASALSAGLDYAPSQPVLPMYPNGTPGTNPRSFKNSIPIRTMTGLGDGMSEGLGRFRREINKVRSPKLLPSSDTLIASVPLEFDEEDEDFLSRETSQQSSQPASPIEPTGNPIDRDLPTKSNVDDVFISDGHGISDSDQWPGWVGEDRKAVDEAETFDDISAVGFMDEEIQAAKVTPPMSKKSKTKKKRNQI